MPLGKIKRKYSKVRAAEARRMATNPERLGDRKVTVEVLVSRVGGKARKASYQARACIRGQHGGGSRRGCGLWKFASTPTAAFNKALHSLTLYGTGKAARRG